MTIDNRLDLTIDQIYQMGNNGEDIQAGLERVYQSTPLGPISSNLVNTMFGINHRMIPLALPQNKDSYGLTFFTRPRLNLSTNNIRYVRQLYPLLNPDSRSVQRILRCTLDPQLAWATQVGTNTQSKISCDYVDPQLIFIPMLSNLCQTISGWPDFVVDTKTTPEGHYRESHSMIDSSVEIRNTYELSASFRNVPNNPITLLFYFWIFYAAKVFEGELIPYGSLMYQNEIDYCTRIYRLILDPQKRYVQHIISCGAAFPLNAPVGALANFDTSQPFNESNDNVNIRFQCIGMDYNDPIQITEFNQAVGILNPAVNSTERANTFIKIPYQLLSFFNMRGYPQINPKTMELEWYVSYAVFNSYAQQLTEYMNIAGVKNQTFMQYLTSGDSSNYANALEDLYFDNLNKVSNGGIIIPQDGTGSSALNTPTASEVQQAASAFTAQ